MLMFNSALHNTTKHQYFQTKYHIMHSQSCIIDSRALRMDYRCDPSWNIIITTWGNLFSVFNTESNRPNPLS